MTTTTRTLGFIGGTGKHGRGLALRFGLAGHRVLLGSRSAERAEEGVEKVRAKAPDADLDIGGGTNLEVAAAADVVIVVVPYASQRATLEPLAEAIGDKVVVNCVNGLAFDDGGPHNVAIPSGSAAEECAQMLPNARVVSAFQNVSAVSLLRVAEPVAGDCFIAGDDPEARALVARLAQEIEGVRAVEVGSLRLAAPLEGMTAVLISVNQRLGGHRGLRISGDL